MIIVTTNNLPGFEITEELGLVNGSTVKAKHIGKDIAAFLKNIVGGELKGYSELLTEGREDALERMKQEAEKLGADAVVCVRLATSSITQGASELMAYGTAVKVRKLD